MGSSVEGRSDCGKEEREDVSPRRGGIVDVLDFCFDVVAEVVDVAELCDLTAAFSV
jgi:hypothetical protein